MKYLLAAILLAMPMMACAGQSQEEAIRTKIICAEGYKFLLVWVSGQWRPPSTVQIYKEGTAPARPPQPIACRN